MVLVNMPVGPLVTPSLGLSLLKSALRGVGIPSKVFYFHITFAKQIGARLYEAIRTSSPSGGRLSSRRPRLRPCPSLGLPVAVSQDPLAAPIPPLEELEERVPSAA